MLDKEKVANVKFTRRGKGYDTLEVDDFLDEIIAGIEEYEKESAAAKAKLDQDKQSLIDAMSAAKTLASDIEIRANREADYTIRKSREEADEYIRSVKAQYDEQIRRINRLKLFCDAYRTAILRDMDAQRKDFVSGFLSESVYAELADLQEQHDEKPEGELVLETSELTPEQKTGNSGKQAQTDEIDYFGLGVNEDVDQKQAVAPKEGGGFIIEQRKSETVPVDAPRRPDSGSEKGELDTGKMSSINLEDIVNGLPQTDEELKALIDEIM